MDLSFVKQKTALVISDFYYRRYFSKIVNSEGFLILTSERAYYLTDARYFLALKEKLSGSNIIPVLFNSNEDIIKILKENDISSFGVDFEKTTIKEFNDYKEFGLEIFDCSQILKEIRSVKSDDEIALIKRACEICEKSFYEVLPYIKVGITEREVASLLNQRYVENGASGESFETIVAFNENSAIPHHTTSDKILTNNSCILIDTGCVYNGYLSDYTRTIFIGEPSKKFVDAYNSVWASNELAEKLIMANLSCRSADAIARGYLKNNDLDKFFTHSLGHGVGLEIHEFPTLSHKKEDVLKDNMVFTIEPGVYFDNEFGIRIEDTVYLKNGRVKRLFTDSKDLIIIK